MMTRATPEVVKCVGCGKDIDRLRVGSKSHYLEHGQNLTHRCEGKPEMRCFHCGKPIRFRFNSATGRLDPCDPDGLEHDCVLSKKAASFSYWSAMNRRMARISVEKKASKPATRIDIYDEFDEFRKGSAATKPTIEKHKADRRRGARLPGSK